MAIPAALARAPYDTMISMETAERETSYDGVHCNLRIEQFPGNVIVLRISGTDVGEFGDAPMKVLDGWISDSPPVDFYIDARAVRGASIDVSREWAAWLDFHKPVLKRITMLTGTPFIRITAEFVRRFASLEHIMRVCTQPAVFERALDEAVKSSR